MQTKIYIAILILSVLVLTGFGECNPFRQNTDSVTSKDSIIFSQLDSLYERQVTHSEWIKNLRNGKHCVNKNQKVKKTYKVKEGADLSVTLTDSDTRYIIKHDYNLNGKFVEVGKNVILDFRGGSISGGTLLLNDSVTITGNAVFRYSSTEEGSDTEYKIEGKVPQTFRAPIIVHDKSNVLIENASFYITSSASSLNGTAAIICYGDKGNDNILIQHCQIDQGAIYLFSKTYNAAIYDCKITNVHREIIAVETIYDYTPWRNPKNIMVLDNYLTQATDAVSGISNGMWCSGFENTVIDGNTFDLMKSILLYCGDGNVALKDIVVSNNVFRLRNEGKDVIGAITLMGKSYQNTTDITPEQSVIIKGNTMLTYAHDDKNGADVDCRAISLRFASCVKVENNVIKGFSHGVDISDSFRGKKFPVNRICIKENTFENIVGQPIFLEGKPKILVEESNKYNNVNKD